MPEAPAWKFKPVIQKLAATEPVTAVITGRVITGVDRQIIEDGFVEIADGAIVAVGSKSELSGGREIIQTSGTVLPGLINSHAHLAWDGIHDLADQSLHDLPEISAYKCATNMLVSLRSGITTVRDL
jgi:imidazolonepropionase-like amidohydrolase